MELKHDQNCKVVPGNMHYLTKKEKKRKKERHWNQYLHGWSGTSAESNDTLQLAVTRAAYMSF